MEKFVRLTAKACPLLLANVDTDQILPARQSSDASCSTICAVKPTVKKIPTFRSTGRRRGTPKSLLPAAISAAARHARRRFMRSMKLASAA
jgi:hypothetical protein